MAACRAKPEFARREPRGAATGTNNAGGIDYEPLERGCAPVAPQPKTAIAGRLCPFFGIVLRRPGKGIPIVIFRLGHQVARLIPRFSIVQWYFINIPRQHAGFATRVDQYDRMMLLATGATEECRVKPCLGIIWVEALTVERNAPLRNRSQCRIDVPGTRKEPVQFERKKRTIAGAAAFIRRPAHEDQHSLKLRLTTGFVTPGLCRKPFCRFRNGDGAAAREPLAVIEPDFKLDPHGKRMIAQSSVIDEIGNFSIDRCTKAISEGRRLEQRIGGALQALIDHGIGIDVLAEKSGGNRRNSVGASRTAVSAGHRCRSADADR
jgi:hypothetical protein